MFLMSISKVSIVASTRSGQFKSFDGEGEVVIIRIIHQKSENICYITYLYLIL